MIKYVIPLYYTVHSRAKGIHFISYFLMVFLPSLLFMIFQADVFQISNIYLYILTFLGMLSVYECGYLVNDVICIKNDPQPTNRITEEEQKVIEQKLPFIIIGKIFICCCISLVLIIFDLKNIFLYGICNILILVVYVIHNNFRNWIPFITVFILTTLNYFTPLSYFLNSSECKFYLGYILLYFSIPKTIFYIYRKISKKSVKNENLKFAIYYLVSIFVTLLLYFMHIAKLIFIIIPIYLSIYRLAIFVARRIK